MAAAHINALSLTNVFPANDDHLIELQVQAD